MKNTKLLKKLSTVFTNVLVYVLGFAMIGSSIALQNANAINSFLGVSTTLVKPAEGTENVDSEYFKSDFNSVAEVQANNKTWAEQIVAEGSVLLKNDNDTLPLAEGSKVALFSISSVDPVYAGTGSSGNNSGDLVDLKTGLEEDGKLTINATLWDWYLANKETYSRSGGGMGGKGYVANDAPWADIPDAKSDATYGDAAIFVIARKGGEGSDLTISGGDTTDLTNGNYLQLSVKETDVLKNLKLLKDQGVYKRIIVIMNSANPVQCDFVDDPQYGVDALLWVGDFGAVGAYAIGDILVGRVNPSGALADTFWKEHWLNPVYANFGDYRYQNDEANAEFEGIMKTVASTNDAYVVYQEGIYNGYRYTETRYEDMVMGRAKTGNFVYADHVSYPFGYGLSYTSFDVSDFTATYNASSDSYTVTVKVTNTGDVAGKKVVQIYLQKPYTDYDIQNKVEKASVELVGYAKTQELAPNASETLTIEVAKRSFASYDAYGAKTYIVDAGDYYLTAATDAHAAINNILAVKGYTTANGMTEDGNAAMVAKFTENRLDTETYSVSAKTGNTITNQFDNADLNLYATGDKSNTVTYVSRNDWEGTVVLGYDKNYNPTNKSVVLNSTQVIRDDRRPRPTADDIEYPTYGSTASSLELIDLRGLDYDDPAWDLLLDQMTREDVVNLLSCGLRMTYGVPSIGKPQTIDHNGATGPVQAFNDNSGVNRGLAVDTNDPDAATKPIVFPCNGLSAASYNDELVKNYGDAWGETCLWAGYNALYGPGVNIHRGAYGGRSFEYYSEDGFLSASIVTNVCQGLTDHGTYVYLKHCVLNDQEKNRHAMSVWSNEQAIREIYLKAFQMPIEAGAAQCVMTGYNRIGSQWTGNQGFINTVLRAEFGMTGHAVTDYYVTNYLDDYMTMPYGLLNGQDLPDGDALGAGNDKYFGNNATTYLNDYAEGYGELAWACRESCHRVLYTVVNSNAMNGIVAGSEIIHVTPLWVTIASNITTIVGVLLAISAAGLLYCLYIEKKKQ